MTRNAPTAAASNVSQLLAVSENEANDVNKSIQNLTELELNFPAFYTVGLLGYCQGPGHMTSFSNCSDPSIRFSFDLLKVIRSTSNGTYIRLQDHDNKAFGRYREFTRWFALLYLVGAVVTVLTILFVISSMVFAWRIRLIPFTCAFVCCNPNSSNLADTKDSTVVICIYHSRIDQYNRNLFPGLSCCSEHSSVIWCARKPRWSISGGLVRCRPIHRGSTHLDNSDVLLLYLRLLAIFRTIAGLGTPPRESIDKIHRRSVYSSVSFNLWEFARISRRLGWPARRRRSVTLSRLRGPFCSETNLFNPLQLREDRKSNTTKVTFCSIYCLSDLRIQILPI